MLLPVAALGQPDPEAHHLPANLTMRQIERSPAVDTSEPLSQESEALVCEHYDLPHGRDHFIWATRQLGSSDPAAQGKPHSSTAGTAATDPVVVRSLAQIIGYSIEATDGDIGHAEDFLIDTAGWQVRYLTVHTSSWWAEEKLLLSPLSIDWIDWARGIIMLDVIRQKVKDSPPYVAAETVDGAFEELFHTYYGFRGPRR